MTTVQTDMTGAQEQALVITREFNAPRARVFRAFSEAERLARWWGPAGFEIHVSKLEFRPGGVFHYRMAHPNGHEMWGQFYYREIVAPERIVWVNTFSDPDGGLTRAPFGPELATFPLEVLNTMTLEERGGKTVLHLRAYPTNATAEERATFEGLMASMQQGYARHSINWPRCWRRTANGRNVLDRLPWRLVVPNRPVSVTGRLGAVRLPEYPACTQGGAPS